VLLLLDEPALGLDLFARRDLMDAVIELVDREGRGVLVCSHLIDDVERLADRVCFLRHGVMLAAGSVDELRDRYRRARLALGAGGASALEGAAAAVVGVRRVAVEGELPASERVVVFEDFDPGALDDLAARAGAEVLETRRMTLREVYFELLAGGEEVRS